MLNESIADGDNLVSIGGSEGRLRESPSTSGSRADVRSKINITACRSVAAAVEETTETRDSCNLKHSNSA